MQFPPVYKEHTAALLCLNLIESSLHVQVWMENRKIQEIQQHQALITAHLPSAVILGPLLSRHGI